MAQLLDLNSLVERPTILLDGESHELRTREELSLVEDHRVVALQKKCQVLAKDFETITEDEVTEAIAALDEICRVLCPTLPVEKLTDTQKASVVEAWAGQYKQEEPAEGGADSPT